MISHVPARDTLNSQSLLVKSALSYADLPLALLSLPPPLPAPLLTKSYYSAKAGLKLPGFQMQLGLQ